MSFKAVHLLRAVCAVAALSAFSGTASADCVEIQNFVKANTDKVATALFEHYGGAEKRVRLGPNAGNYAFMTLRSKPSVIDVKGCTVKLELQADKESPPQSGDVTSARQKEPGKVTLDVGFIEPTGLKLCMVSPNRVSSADWRDEGRPKEEEFVKNNKNKTYFSGCLF